MIVEAQWAAARINGVPLTSLQPRYSLISREIEAEVLPTAERHGLGTLVYGALAGGVLTGKYKRGQAPASDARYGGSMGMLGDPGMVAMATKSLSERNLDIAEAVVQVAAELNTTPGAVATAWCLSRRGITSVIIGPRTLGQLHDYLPGFELTLSETALKRLSDSSRPSGGRP